jgi:hypothetical protein
MAAESEIGVKKFTTIHHLNREVVFENSLWQIQMGNVG